MTTRLSRLKADPSIYVYKASGGMLDLFDNAFKQALRVTDSEYDWLAENLSDEELGLIVTDPELKSLTFTERRQIILILRKGYGK